MLSKREQRQLSEIEARLCASDPELALLLRQAGKEEPVEVVQPRRPPAVALWLGWVVLVFIAVIGWTVPALFLLGFLTAVTVSAWRAGRGDGHFTPVGFGHLVDREGDPGLRHRWSGSMPDYRSVSPPFHGPHHPLL